MLKFGEELIEAFERMMTALSEVVQDKLPGLVEQAQDFVDKAEQVKDSASGEFDSMNPLEKGKALGFMGINMAQMPKVSSQIKEALANYKAFITDI